MIEGEDHRFFLALLLNVQDRTMLLDLIKQRFPKVDPVDQAVSWIKELAAIRIFGSHEANVLGLQEYDSSQLAVFAALMRGQSDDEIEAQAKRPVTELVQRFRTLPLFQSILGRPRQATYLAS